MQIFPETKLAETIHMNYGILPILNRFGIQLGFGDITLKEACSRYNINLDFFLEIVNSYNDTSYFPQVQLQAFPLKLIIDYIDKSHTYYLNRKVPQIEQLIEEVLDKTKHKNDYRLIDKFYKEYKKELIEHIDKEEQEIHPYVFMLEEAYLTRNFTEEIVHHIEENSINKYAREHNSLEDKLYDLKNLIIKYLPPVEDPCISNSLLIELFRLERDLNDHARIENKVLIPKVVWLEQQILVKQKI